MLDPQGRLDLRRPGVHISAAVVTAKGIYARPDETLARVRRSLLDRGATGLPSRFDDEWRVHFPTQGGVRRAS